MSPELGGEQRKREEMLEAQVTTLQEQLARVVQEKERVTQEKEMMLQEKEQLTQQQHEVGQTLQLQVAVSFHLLIRFLT